MIRDPERLQHLLLEVRQFVREIAIPNEDRVEAEDKVPEEIVAEARRRGFFGWSIPEAYGGAGLTSEELVLAFLELSQCSVAYRVHFGTNAGIGSETVVQDGTEAQRQHYLPRLASGDMIGALALTEEAAGSDALSLETRAEATGDGAYLLNGSKRYITLAPIADLFAVFARTGPANKAPPASRRFWLSEGQPGLRSARPHRRWGRKVRRSANSAWRIAACRKPASSAAFPGAGSRR